jgi:hypothetical protein
MFPCIRGALLEFSTGIPAISAVGSQLLQRNVLLLMDRAAASTFQASSKTQSQSPQVGAGNTAVTNCIGQLCHTSAMAEVIDLRYDAAVKADTYLELC